MARKYQVPFMLSEETHQQLKAASVKTRMSMSEIIRILIAEYLEKELKKENK